MTEIQIISLKIFNQIRSEVEDNNIFKRHCRKVKWFCEPSGQLYLLSDKPFDPRIIHISFRTIQKLNVDPNSMECFAISNYLIFSELLMQFITLLLTSCSFV